MNSKLLLVGTLSSGLALLACESGEEGDSGAVAAASSTGSTPMPTGSTPGAGGTGSDSTSGQGGTGNGTPDAPSATPTVVPFESPFAGAGNTPDGDAADAGGAAPGDGDVDTECPSIAPADGTACDVPFFDDCQYDELNCVCVGGMGGGERGWFCSEGDGFDGMFPGMDEDDEDPEPEAPADCPDGGECPEEPMQPADGGFMPEPEPENPETCPDEAPPDPVCDIETVGFNTSCRFGSLVCTCGGFVDDGEWRCVEDEPEPQPEAEPEVTPDPTEAGVPPPEPSDAG